jgi:homoaconitase/3-isopropylmalate dehydratase large subunit
MDSQIIFQKLLEQSPVVITLGVVIYFLYKKLLTTEHNMEAQRVEHKEELKELNTYVRDREIQHIETLNNLTIIIQNLDEKMDVISKAL